MKGYSPTFNINPKSEIASKVQSAFFELGVKNIKHKENCTCEECNNKNT